MDPIFSKQLLVRALQSNHETVALWSAYQLLTLYPDNLEDSLHFFLESPFLDIQEAGIAKASETKSTSFVPRLMRFFKEKQGILKQSSAIALAKHPNDIINNLLQRWFDQTFSDDSNASSSDFQSAALALLEADKEKQTLIRNKLEQLSDNIVPSSILFSILLNYSKAEDSFSSLLEQYFRLRNLHSDVELTKQLIQIVDQLDILELISKKIDEKSSFLNFFQLCYELLKINMPLEVFKLLEDLDKELSLSGTEKSSFELQNPEAVFNILLKWIHLFPDQEYETDLDRKINLTLSAFHKHAEDFNSTIPKILEYETSFLLSLPLVVLINRQLRKWLEDPYTYSEQIASYYQSSLLTLKNREKILEAFYPDDPDFSTEEYKIKDFESNISSGLEQRDLLWSLYKGDLLQHKIPWPSLFPDPDHSVHLLRMLKNYYLANFDHYVETQDKLSIDYALLLFQSFPEKDVIEIVSRNFQYLFQHHTDVLFQTIEYNPAQEFVPQLVSYYQPDEIELFDLISHICNIYELDLPDQLTNSKKVSSADDEVFLNNNRIRLNCPHCEHSFQYLAGPIYVDEETLNRDDKLTMASVWVDKQFQCKNCSKEFPMKLEEHQLEDLATQSRVNRLLKLTSQSKKNRLFQKVHLINFPRFEGKVYNPDEFAKFVSEHENQASLETKLLTTLYYRLAKAFEQTDQFGKAIDVVNKISEQETAPKKMITLGILYFKNHDFIRSREYLQKILIYGDQEKLLPSEQPYLEQANYYLELMNSKSLKRKQFRVISGSK